MAKHVTVTVTDLPGSTTGVAPTVVIEGLSEWTEKQYFPAALRLLEVGQIKHIHVTDDSRSYQNDPTERAKAEERKITVLDMVERQDLMSKVHFIDKATEETVYRDLEAEVVFIVTPPDTHLQIAMHWLSTGNVKLIFIEKPLGNDINDRQLVALRDALNVPDDHRSYRTVFNVDHYLLRAHQLFNIVNDVKLMQRLGKPTRLKLRMIESGGVDRLTRLGLKSGLILDMMCHLIALVHVFGNLETIVLKEIRVARCGDAPWYRRETFADLSFSFEARASRLRIDAEAAIGKGVVSDDDSRLGKYIELVGENGTLIAELEGDFRVATEIGGIRENLGPLLTTADVYGDLFRVATRGSVVDWPALLTFESATVVLSFLEVMQRSLQLEALPMYEVGATHSSVARDAQRYDLSALNRILS